MTEPLSQDPYVYPDTNVLINKEGIKDQARLEEFERLMSAVRMEQPLKDVPISEDGYKAIHKHIFQDVYEWAGKLRLVDMAKGNSFFELPEQIERSLERTFSQLNAEYDLIGMSRSKFAERAARHISELNHTHPFREGNGRTLRTFLKVLARQAGHEIDLTRIKPEAWNRASIAGFKENYGPMQEVIRGALRERARDREGQGKEPASPVQREAENKPTARRTRKRDEGLGR